MDEQYEIGKRSFDAMCEASKKYNSITTHLNLFLDNGIRDFIEIKNIDWNDKYYERISCEKSIKNRCPFELKIKCNFIYGERRTNYDFIQIFDVYKSKYQEETFVFIMCVAKLDRSSVKNFDWTNEYDGEICQYFFRYNQKSNKWRCNDICEFEFLEEFVNPIEHA